MDPLSVTAAAAQLIFSFAKICKSLDALKNTYQHAPMTIVSMSTECKTISTALTHLQNLAQTNPTALSSNVTAQDTLVESFDNALTGCMVTLSVIEGELNKLVEGNKGLGSIGFRARAGFIWNKDTMEHLLQHLRGQHTAINTLVTLLQAESLAETNRLLRENTATFQKSAQQARSLRSYRPEASVSGTATEKPLSIFNLSLTSPVDASSNINAQLQQSSAYQNAGAASAEELWRRNEELKEENGGLRDKVFDLEQEEQKKSQTIAGLLNKVATLQKHTNDLKRQLQARTETAEQFSAYHATFRQTGLEFVQKFQHQRRKMAELEDTLSNLRESQAEGILSHLIQLHEAWNKPMDTALLSTPRRSPQPGSSPRLSVAGNDMISISPPALPETAG